MTRNRLIFHPEVADEIEEARYVLQPARDLHFRYSMDLVRSLLFIPLDHNLRKRD